MLKPSMQVSAKSTCADPYPTKMLIGPEDAHASRRVTSVDLNSFVSGMAEFYSGSHLDRWDGWRAVATLASLIGCIPWASSILKPVWRQPAAYELSAPKNASRTSAEEAIPDMNSERSDVR